MATAYGVIGIACWVTSSSATYFGNPSGNYKNLTWGDCSIDNYVYTEWPTSDMSNFEVYSVDVTICGNETATSAWTGDIYIEDCYLGTFSYPQDSAQGAGWSCDQTLSGTPDITLSDFLSMDSSALECSIRYCSSDSTGNKFYTKSSYVASWIYIYYSYSTNSVPSDHPTVRYPAAHYTYTYRSNPYIACYMPTDPDGNQMQLGYAVYDRTTSSWPISTTWLSTWYDNNEYAAFYISGLTSGHSYQVQVYARDTSYELPSSNTSQHYKIFYMVSPTSTTLSTGTKFDDSHIDNLQTDILVVAPYYNWGTPSFTTCDLGTKGLAAHMVEIDDALWNYFPLTGHFYTDDSNGDVPAGVKINASLYNAAITQLLKC